MENKNTILQNALENLTATINQLNKSTSKDPQFLNSMRMRINSISLQISELSKGI